MTTPVMDAAHIDPVRSAVTRRLLPWFRAHARDLPWRRNRTPYRVLVSELMLQQTRVDQAEPYFERFMKRFPTLRALAAADESDVLKAWEGLGYYARARNLHRLAQRLAAERGGRFPRTHAELLTLPGVGPYTAAAVAGFAFGLDAPLVDGNVRRVFARIFTLDEVRRERLDASVRDLASALLPAGRGPAFNEALMELGATVCLPRGPQCGACPLRAVCRARAAGSPERWPRPRPRKPLPHLVVGAAVTTDARGRILIARRRSEGLLGGLWEFPGGKIESGETMAQCIARELREEMGIEIEVGERLTVVRHAYSHFTIELHAHFARRLRGRPRRIHCADFAWVPRARLRDYAFSRADLHIIEAIEAACAKGG
jgi:A/G-specific adenine glycosylase